MSIVSTAKDYKRICNIEYVRCIGLCTGCGTCLGICPNDAIRMDRHFSGIYLPIVSDEKCSKCGLCLKVCPGLSVDFCKLNSFVFGRIPEDPLIGNYVNCYLGHTLDERILFNASSGGIVTSLLVFGLERGIIDKAQVVQMRAEAPLEPEPIDAQTEEEIVMAGGSKYCPASVNVLIKRILDGSGKYAVVGLPCHIHGIRKAEMADQRLKQKIVLHIGLFCSHTVNFLGTELLLEKIGILKQNVNGIDYRGGSWPGRMLVRLNDNCEKSIPYKHYWDCLFGPYFFTPIRCTLCADATNELSDISVGDAWLPELKKNHKGESIIIARTIAGLKFLNLARLNKKIKLAKLDQNRVKLSQLCNLNFKKKTMKSRILLLRCFGKTAPYGNPEPPKQGKLSFLSNLLVYLSIYISSKRRLRWVLKYVPFAVLRMYFKLVCALLMFTG